ncbi:MAG: CxxxxCH/CxxCH domain-containing protein [Desulfuromonadales bacterium]|nr:CxxxxCH/CxxCH domain-containing protein [Desulfuromonadales bacterium]
MATTRVLFVALLFALLAYLIPDTITAETAVHTFDCKNCHIPSLSVEQLGGGNVCLSCHDDTLNMALGDGTTGSTNSAFNNIDASNAMGYNPGALAGSGQTSHNWGAPDAQPRAGAVAPSRTLHPQFYSRFGSSQGKVTCSRCHNPHADRTNPQLLVTGPGSAQQMCLACHVTWNQGSGMTNVTHPVNIDYTAAAAAHPGRYAAAPPEDDGDLGTDGRISLFGGKLLCGSCHQTHFADSNAITADIPENFATLSSGGGDGKLLRVDGAGRADKSALCRTCHTYQAHGDASGEKAGCMVCHSGHSYDPVAPNYYMLRKNATTTTYGAVSGLDYSSAGVLDANQKFTYWNDQMDGVAAGYCEKCHGDARTIGDGAGRYHVAAAICTECHLHSQGDGTFVAGCTTCHGVPPGTATLGGPNGLVNMPGTTGSSMAGAHNAHSVGKPYPCSTCHLNSVGSGAKHISIAPQTVTLGFSLFNGAYVGGTYNGQAAVAYDTSQATTTVSRDGTRTCVNIYCHGGTMASNGGTDTTPVWNDASTGTCGKCHGATSTSPPQSGSHRTHVMNDTWWYAPNTESPFNNYIYGRNLACFTCHNNAAAAHVDGKTEWSFDTTVRPWLAGARYKGGMSGAAAPVPGIYGQCSNLYCHSIVQTSTGGALTGQAGEYKTPTWGTRLEGNCGSCHYADQGHSFWAGRGMSFTEISSGSHPKHLTYLTTAVGGGSNGPSRCGACHNYAGSDDLAGCASLCHNQGSLHVNHQIDVKFPPTKYGASAAYSGTPGPGDGYGTCANVNCHGAAAPVWGVTEVCGGCHTVVQGNRAAITGQFAGNSHHVQGTSLTGQHCYQCHWEANGDGTVNQTYHGGTSAALIDLVVYGTAARPTSYTGGATAIQYKTDGSRGEITKLNSHCLGCHSDANDAATPFGDGKTPKQYAWDGTSVARRYSQAGTTPWGKYGGANVTPKNAQSKAYSAHGNATANQGGWDLGETWSNTRIGTVNVACYDCHNSHGSNVAGKTTSYASATVNGGLLKDTQASKGGYTATYKPVAGGTVGTSNVRNAGASLCFDCHLNAASSESKPWGYQSTFGAAQPILGYYDTPDLAPGNAGAEQRYPYKAIPAYKGGHFGASSPLQSPAMASINGLCTPCHDPHGVSPSLGASQQYGVPLLKGTWLTSPYKEDVAPDSNNTGLSVGEFLHIDQNTFGNYWDLNTLVAGITQTDTQFAGLCLNCHPKTSLTGTTHAWNSKDRVHEAVKGWKTANGNFKHNYSCSKCHTPHIGSSLPRLMVTNCLDPTHKGRTGGIPYPATSGSGDGGSGRIPGSNACHEGNTGAGTNQRWNQVTPWYGETATLAITSGPTTGQSSDYWSGNRAFVTWDTNIASNSFVDYGPTAAYGLTATDGTWVNTHNVGVSVGSWPTGLPNHSTFNYRVRSTSVKGQQVASGDRTAYLNLPPNPVSSVISPSPYSSPACPTACSLTFSWNPTTDPDGGPIQYLVEVDNDSSYGSIDATSGWISATSVTLGPLASNTYWYWRVKARDTNHPEVVSTSYPYYWFRTAQPTPTTPTNLSTPANPTCTGSCSVDLSWTASSNGGPGPFQYYVQIDDDPAFATPNATLAWVSGTVTGSTVTVPSGTLATAKTWYWRVKARDANATTPESAYSSRASFLIYEASTTPGVPTPKDEANLYCTGSCLVNLAWFPGVNNPNYGAVEYELQIDDDPGFGSVDANAPWTIATDANVTLNVSLPTVDKTWYFRVRSRYQAHTAVPSDWSPAKSFHLIYPTPSKPSGLAAPADTVCPGGCSIALSWSPSTSYGGGPFDYQVEVDTVTAFNSINKKVLTWNPATTASVAFGVADVGKTWYWRVQARDISNVAALSSWSNTASFRTLTVSPPAAPTIISHGSFDSGCADTPVTVSWNPVTSPDGDSVQYYVHTDSFGDSGWLPAGTTSWSFTMYAGWGVTWQVMARDAVHQDASSTWSAAEYFYDVGSGCWTSSCPLVFGWTGDSYSYMTDLAGPILALRPTAADRAVTQYHPELAAVNGLVPGSDGQFHVKIRESLPEITYLDTATLLAVDAPEGYEVHTSWGEATYVYGYVNPFKIYTAKDALAPVSAYDRNGNDALAAMLSVDNTPAHLEPFDAGFYYTVDFGPVEHPEFAKLLIDGWTLFGSESLPATQLVAPAIHVVDQTGNWVKVKSFGTPTGDLKTMVVDLANVFLSNDHRIRIYTGMRPKSRWLIDRIRLDQSAPVDVNVLELPAMTADLQFAGNAIHAMSNLSSRIVATDATLPVNPEYPSYGKFTRYGDVTPLLSSSDDKFVIMREGDKVDVSFPVPDQPQSGFARSFFVKSDLYYKSLRVTNTVEPLPFHGMSSFPYPATESYPEDADHQQYLQEYNTRTYSP